MTCTKTRIIEKVAQENDLKPAEAKDAVETLLEIIKETLASGEEVMVSGFGKFRVRDKKPRMGRNPATGDSLLLDKRRVVTFKCAGKLRDMMNGAGS